MGLQPASMTTHLSANTEDADCDSDSEMEFGGEDAFEDCQSKNFESLRNEQNLFVCQMQQQMTPMTLW